MLGVLFVIRFNCQRADLQETKKGRCPRPAKRFRILRVPLGGLSISTHKSNG